MYLFDFTNADIPLDVLNLRHILIYLLMAVGAFTIGFKLSICGNKMLENERKIVLKVIWVTMIIISMIFALIGFVSAIGAIYCTVEYFNSTTSNTSLIISIAITIIGISGILISAFAEKVDKWIFERKEYEKRMEELLKKYHRFNEKKKSEGIKEHKDSISVIGVILLVYGIYQILGFIVRLSKS